MTPTSIADNIESISKILLEAGRISRTYFRTGNWKIKADESLITKADNEIEALLCEYFDHPENGTFVLGEETVDARSEDYLLEASRRRTFVIDPIDGTAPYANGLREWGISIGLMGNSLLSEGAIFLPAQGELFITGPKEALFAENITAETKAADINFKTIPSEGFGLRRGGMIALSQWLAKNGTIDTEHPVQACGSAVQAGTNLLLQRYGVVISHIKIWDVAAVLPLIRQCGLVCRLTDGRLWNGELDSSFFHLDPDAEKRWSMVSGCTFGTENDTKDILKIIT